MESLSIVSRHHETEKILEDLHERATLSKEMSQNELTAQIAKEKAELKAAEEELQAATEMMRSPDTIGEQYLSGLQSLVQGYVEDQKRLEHERDLEKQAREADSREFAVDIAKLKTELHQIKLEREAVQSESFRAQRDLVESHNKQLEEWLGRQKSQQDENYRLRHLLLDASDNQFSELSKTAGLRTDKTRLEAEVSSLKLDNSTLQADNNNMQGENSKLLGANAKLQDQVNKLSADATELRSSNAKASSEASIRAARIEELGNEMSTLKQESAENARIVQDARKAREEMEQKMEGLRLELDTVVKDRDEKASKLQSNSESIHSLRKELKYNKAKVERYQARDEAQKTCMTRTARALIEYKEDILMLKARLEDAEQQNRPALEPTAGHHSGPSQQT